MELKLIEINHLSFAEIIAEEVVITEVQDALDLMADAGYQGAQALIVHEENLIPEFFDLKTKIAGEILQKFSTYNFRLAIIGDFSKFDSKSLRDFIYESNKVGRIIFTDTLESAIEKLSLK